MQKLIQSIRMVAFAVLLVFLACNIYAEHSGRYLVPIPHKLIFAAGFIILWSVVVFLRWKAQGTEQAIRMRLKIYFVVLFLYYLWILGNMLFFDAAFGRAHSGPLPPFNFYEADINLEPFKTILDYISAYKYGNISGYLVAVNLFGNLAAFAPMGFFLPVLIRLFRNFFVFTFGIAFMVCAVEVTQIWTRTGSCDIDDLILNLAGALAVWLFIQLPPIRRHAYRAVPKRKG